MTIDYRQVHWNWVFVLSTAVALAGCSSSSTTNDGAQPAGGSGGTTSLGSGGSITQFDATVASTGGATTGSGGSTVGSGGAGVDAVVVSPGDAAGGSDGFTTGTGGVIGSGSSTSSGGSTAGVDAGVTISGDAARAGSGFESSAEDWTIIGDAQKSSAKPDYYGTGGNPDGLISAVDDVAGGVWFFQAPAKYLGNASSTYGHYIEFDLKTTDVSSLFDDFDVVLAGNGITLGYYFASPRDPGTNTWTSYKVQLGETAGWVKISDYDYNTFGANFDSSTLSFTGLTEPSQAEFQSVLSNLTQFLIRGEFNNGSDTGYLDNVRFGASQ